MILNGYPLAKPDIGEPEKQAVLHVLDSGQLSRGPAVKAFEHAFKETCQVEHAAAVSSGTAGLILALKALNVAAGDEVITVSFTVPATVNAIFAVGAKPVLIDINEQNLGMCVDALKTTISPSTKAVILVHAFGQAADVEAVSKLCHTHRLPLIEDACEVIGNSYHGKPLGTWGDVGVFGFYPNKQITCAEGGMVICHSATMINTIKQMRNHGRTMNGDLFDQHSVGWNFRLSELAAALGLAQLQRLQEFKRKRQQIANYYDHHLNQVSGIELPQFSQFELDSAWFVYVIKIKQQRDAVYACMQQNHIQCGRYFSPVHQQPYWQTTQATMNLPLTEKIASQTLALPFYTSLEEQDVSYICKKLITCCQR